MNILILTVFVFVSIISNSFSSLLFQVDYFNSPLSSSACVLHSDGQNMRVDTIYYDGRYVSSTYYSGSNMTALTISHDKGEYCINVYREGDYYIDYKVLTNDIDKHMGGSLPLELSEKYSMILTGSWYKGKEIVTASKNTNGIYQLQSPYWKATLLKGSDNVPVSPLRLIKC